MADSHQHGQKHEIEEDYSELEDFNSDDMDSDDSEEDPTYNDDVHEAQSKFSKLSIKSKSNSSGRDYEEMEKDDGNVTFVEKISALKLETKDMKSIEQIQKIIDSGEVDKLKVDQCKVYLRVHGLRLTGKKDTLIQRIKEHREIQNGGGEKKYPPSSFVLNCKGDACMGDVVMFEQTVYERYSHVSRSAIGPPLGTRIVAGRIVKESYGAEKQQHTFTVEVLWSKGQQPLGPLHPLLIKGRNLYKLNTMRQRWDDEGQRQKVLNDKHSRGALARSNREARIQEKEAKKMLKGIRDFPKQLQKSQQQHVVTQKTQRQKTSQEQNSEVPGKYKENSFVGPPRSQPNMPASCSYQKPISQLCPEYKFQNPHPSFIDPKTFQNIQLIEPIFQSYGGHSRNHFNGKAEFSEKFQQMQQAPRCLPHMEFKENVFPPVRGNHSFQHTRPPVWGNHQREPLLVSRNCNHPNNPLQRPSHTQKQQRCKYYPQGRCYYGNQCKFLHD